MTSITLSPAKIRAFQRLVKDFYAKSGRGDLLWRQPDPNGIFDPYKIMVSEIMLQQTQVSRVTPKYQTFLQIFPTVEALAKAPLASVLKEWSGLGYNRRAKFLHSAAQKIQTEFNGVFPKTDQELTSLPGVGANTAAAILAYSFNQPVVFIETNIRSVYLHHFYPGTSDISDKQLLELVEATLDTISPRQWYWALMDYGSYLKSTLPNPSRRSKHYVVQSSFKGSRRQIRGQVLKLLLEKPVLFSELESTIVDERLSATLAELAEEQLISRHGNTYHLGK